MIYLDNPAIPLGEYRHHHNGMAYTLTCTQTWKHECAHTHTQTEHAQTPTHTNIQREEVRESPIQHTEGKGIYNESASETVGCYLH